MKNFLEKVQKKGPAGRKRKDRRGTGLGRRTREEIAKWNQMTALGFQTRVRHPTSQPPFRGHGHGSVPLLTQVKLIISSQLTLKRNGRWGTTGDFATSFLHFSLFSIALSTDTTPTVPVDLRKEVSPASRTGLHSHHWTCGS